MTRPDCRAVAFLMVAGLLTGCAGSPPAPQPSAQAIAPSSGALLNLNEAVTALAVDLTGRLGAADPTRQRRIVVDSFIDYATGEQNQATRTMEARITAALRERRLGFVVEPLSSMALEAQPLVLLGVVAPVTGAGITAPLTQGNPGAYRVWTVLTDPGTGRIIARAEAWLRPTSIDPTPTRFVQAAPAWTPELTTAAYLRTANSAVGAAADPAYVEGLPAQALTADGTRAFEAGRYGEAVTIYRQAEQLPGGRQMRVLNGSYLAYTALGQRQQAADAFARVVDHGLSRGRLAIRFVFQPGSTAFWRDRTISGPYPVWLRLVARSVADRDICLILVGHSSPTGPAPLNDRLSLARAERVRGNLVIERAVLRPRMQSEGRGAREPIIGSGADDVTDVLDRRVEFTPVNCAVLPEQG